MISHVPVKHVVLHNVGQPRLVREEHGQVRGEDRLLHHVQNLLVLLWVEAVKQAVFLSLEDADSHGEMVVLHGGGGVDLGQGGLDVDHELVVVSSVVQIMTDGSYPLSQALHWTEDTRRCLEDAVDAVTDVEAVGPVVVGHTPVVRLHGDEETHLQYTAN